MKRKKKDPVKEAADIVLKEILKSILRGPGRG